MTLTKKLDAWTAAKLISQKQRGQILAFEQARAKNAGLLGFMWIGVFCIGLGLISLIASNWDAIPDNAKLGGGFFAFAALLFGTYKSDETGRTRWFEAGLALAFILCGALIGLVAQVFHLTAQNNAGLLLWAAASLPVVLCSRHRLLGFVWWTLFGYALMNDYMINWLFKIFDGFPLSATMFSVALCAAVAYAAGRFRAPLMKALSVWAVIGMYLSVLAGEFAFYDAYRSVLPGFAFSVLFLSGMSFICLKTGHMKSFNANTLLIALRILILYFQLFINLALTGLGLIVSGIVILTVAVLWQKIKKVLLLKNRIGGKHA